MLSGLWRATEFASQRLLTHAWRQRMIDDELPDANNQFFHLFARGSVGDLHDESLTTLSPHTEVFDRRIHDRTAGNRNQRVVACPNPRAPKTDVFDRTFAPGDPNNVTDPELLLDCNKQRTNQIGDRALRRQRDSETTKTQPGAASAGGRQPLSSSVSA